MDIKLKVKDHPIILTFNNVNHKNILFNISGEVKPGEILVIMGPSGAGKTTLMNILAGRLPAEGRVTLNGDPKIMARKRYIAYVTQDDLIFSNLTVRQNLSFTARLRLPKSERDRVEEVIYTLGLDKCADTPVGGMINIIRSDVRGISGGERRRTIIGNAMLTNPMLIFLDEPTSGLDASSALSLYKTIKNLAADGRTIILTLHQPSSELFNIFDKLLLLTEGHCVYFGPAKDMMGYFNHLGYYCDRYYNPADFSLKLLTNEVSKTNLINQNFAVEPRSEVSEQLPESQKFNLSWPSQIWVLFQRQLILNRNSVDYLSWAQFLLIGILIGLLWFHLDSTDKNIPIKNSVFIMGLLFCVGMTPVFLSLISFPMEKIVLIKERATGSYQLSAYYIAKRLAEIPFETIPVLLYVIPMYWLVWFRQDAFFLVHLSIMILTYYTSSALGLIFGAIFTNIKLALVIMTLFVLMMILSSGFYIPISQLPVWIRWVNWISYFKWSYDALIFTEYIGRNITSNSTSIGSDVIFTTLGLVGNLWISILALVGFCVLFHIGSYVAIAIFC